ncbi:unnamed protein product [Soboliphyme baturini]|uniref:Conserved oligomeric Golgi complex subunit 3 n=1 Tax=Soboliphyme baturini TaxID=241478 RepID=A0A183J5S8_9BILA|nr:unnamed protein product [Soboliphyme baturini]
MEVESTLVCRRVDVLSSSFSVYQNWKTTDICKYGIQLKDFLEDFELIKSALDDVIENSITEISYRSASIKEDVANTVEKLNGCLMKLKIAVRRQLWSCARTLDSVERQMLEDSRSAVQLLRMAVTYSPCFEGLQSDITSLRSLERVLPCGLESEISSLYERMRDVQSVSVQRSDLSRKCVALQDSVLQTICNLSAQLSRDNMSCYLYGDMVTRARAAVAECRCRLVEFLERLSTTDGVQTLFDECQLLLHKCCISDDSLQKISTEHRPDVVQLKGMNLPRFSSFVSEALPVELSSVTVTGHEKEAHATLHAVTDLTVSSIVTLQTPSISVDGIDGSLSVVSQPSEENVIRALPEVIEKAKTELESQSFEALPSPEKSTEDLLPSAPSVELHNSEVSKMGRFIER